MAKKNKPEDKSILDCLNDINEVKAKIRPIFSLMAMRNPTSDGLSGEDQEGLCWLFRDMTDKIFEASDGIYKIFRREHAEEKSKAPTK